MGENIRFWFFYTLMCIAALIAALMAVFLTINPASAHDAIPTAAQPLGWAYGIECCSINDCKDMPEGEIKSTPTGWRVESTGEVIPYGDRRIKQSKDELFHRCAVSGDFTRKTSLCLYVPDMGF